MALLCHIEKPVIGHEQGCREIIGKFDMAPVNAALRRQTAVFRDGFKNIREFHKTQYMRHLECAVWVVQRFRELQGFAFHIMNAKGVLHLLDGKRGNADAMLLMKPCLQHHVHLVRRAGPVGGQLFRRPFQRIEMVAAAAEEIVDRRLGRQRHHVGRHLLISEPHDVVDGGTVALVQLEEGRSQHRGMVDRQPQLVKIGGLFIEYRILNGGPKISQKRRAAVGNDILPVDPELRRKGHQHGH